MENLAFGLRRIFFLDVLFLEAKSDDRPEAVLVVAEFLDVVDVMALAEYFGWYTCMAKIRFESVGFA